MYNKNIYELIKFVLRITSLNIMYIIVQNNEMFKIATKFKVFNGLKVLYLPVAVSLESFQILLFSNSLE